MCVDFPVHLEHFSNQTTKFIEKSHTKYFKALQKNCNIKENKKIHKFLGTSKNQFFKWYNTSQLVKQFGCEQENIQQKTIVAYPKPDRIRNLCSSCF